MRSLATGLAGGKEGVDLIKIAVELLKRPGIDRNEIMSRLTELQGLVLDDRSALSDGEDENRALARGLEEANRLRDIGADMEFQQDGGFYLRKAEREQGILNPHCPVCWGLTLK